MTLQQQCYHGLRKNGGSGSIGYLAATLGMSRSRVGGALERLAGTGWLRRIGEGAYEIVREGEPADGRGRSAASQANLSAHGRAKGMQVCRLKVKPQRIVHVPKPTTALEQAWGWMPSFPALHEEGEG